MKCYIIHQKPKKMYKSFVAFIVISNLLIAACNSSANSKPVKQDNLVTASEDTAAKKDTTPVKPGGDRDEHGCIPSAGYRWSIVLDTCIRIFEAGIKMEPKDPSLDKTVAAFVVLSPDKARAEIFLPTQPKQVIIRKTEGGGTAAIWANGPLKLSLKDGVYSLYDDGKLLYQGASAN
jgi:hypothetical protein